MVISGQLQRDMMCMEVSVFGIGTKVDPPFWILQKLLSWQLTCVSQSISWGKGMEFEDYEEEKGCVMCVTGQGSNRVARRQP